MPIFAGSCWADRQSWFAAELDTALILRRAIYVLDSLRSRLWLLDSWMNMRDGFACRPCVTSRTWRFNARVDQQATDQSISGPRVSLKRSVLCERQGGWKVRRSLML